MPNKYLFFLILLIPVWIILIYFFSSIIPSYHNLVISFDYKFFLQAFLTILISFLLYAFGLWSAGDTKYIIILGLFIPYIGIITFLGNIAILTLIFMLLYFLWIYFGKCIFNHNYRKSIYTNIKNDLTGKWEVHKNKKGGKSFYIILRWLIIFFLFFLGIRLIRFYTLNEIYNKHIGNLNFISNIPTEYYFYIIIGLIGILFLLIFIIRLMIGKLHLLINKKLKINKQKTGNIIITALFISLLSFIFYEYIKNPIEITNLLYKIFTLYLLLFIIIKIIIYSYKITFGISEVEYIDINELKKGDIIDKPYLISMFGKQDIIKNKKYLYELKGPLSDKDIKYIISIYKKVNKYHKEHNESHEENNCIKKLKIFSFSSYIFIGFLLSLFFGNEIIKYIVLYIIDFFQIFFS